MQDILISQKMLSLYNEAVLNNTSFSLTLEDLKKFDLSKNIVRKDLSKGYSLDNVEESSLDLSTVLKNIKDIIPQLPNDLKPLFEDFHKSVVAQINPSYATSLIDYYKKLIKEAVRAKPYITGMEIRYIINNIFDPTISFNKELYTHCITLLKESGEIFIHELDLSKATSVVSNKVNCIAQIPTDTKFRVFSKFDTHPSLYNDSFLVQFHLDKIGYVKIEYKKFDNLLQNDINITALDYIINDLIDNSANFYLYELLYIIRQQKYNISRTNMLSILNKITDLKFIKNNDSDILFYKKEELLPFYKKTDPLFVKNNWAVKSNETDVVLYYDAALTRDQVRSEFAKTAKVSFNSTRAQKIK